MLRTIKVAGAIAACVGMLGVCAPMAAAWNIQSLSNTTVAPGEQLVYVVTAINNGTSATDGTQVVLTATLPSGVTAATAVLYQNKEQANLDPEKNYYESPCTAGDGASPVNGAVAVRCVVSARIGSQSRCHCGDYYRILDLKANVPADAPERKMTASFSVSGGGRRLATTVDPTTVSTLAPDFGVDAFDMRLQGARGVAFTQAAAHPDVVTNLDFNTTTDPVPIGGPAFPVQPMRDVYVDLPPGLVGNPASVGECTSSELAHTLPGFNFDPTPLCPPSSQVGTIAIHNDGLSAPFGVIGVIGPLPLYNMVPPPGEIARFGFNLLGTSVVLDAKLRSGEDYGVTIVSANNPEVLPIVGVETTFWGEPGAASHDSERACPGEEAPFGGGATCPGGGATTAFLRSPTSCSGSPLPFSVHTDSWTHSGALDGAGEPNLQDPAWKSRTMNLHESPSYPVSPEEWGEETALSGCGRVPVNGTLSATPSALETETPSGLTVHVDVPNLGLENPEGIASSDLKAVKVALPAGMTINPSQAEGLGVCTPAEYASTQLSFYAADRKGCPSDSKIGSIVLHTPLLKEAIEGDVYVAAPFDNPFKSLLALYMVLENVERGILIKQAGDVQTDAVTGQITTTFDNIPQLPFSNFDFKFREGARAPLVTPATCGSFETKAWFTPWSDPSRQLESDSQLQIVEGIGGGACPAGGVPPFAPQVVSGTQNNAAAVYSPFLLHIARQDGEQEITRFTTILPPGLTGNLTGIPFCSDGAIEAARHRTGAQEFAAPSCSAASEIGHTIVGAGVGSVVAHTPGKLYLAGPYHGAALSLVSITSATVGPFDLGTVVIRFALKINPTTAQVEVDSAGSDPIPHIIKGIVVHVRDIRVYVDRPNFIRNPTSCASMGITNTITGAGADYTNPADQSPVTVNTRFQAADCSLLGFKQTFKASTSGNTSRENGASLHVALTDPKALEGEANIRSVKVDLPKQLPSRLTTLQKACLDSVFNANPAACPAASRVGTAKAVTPILPEPLVGPAYFVSHGGAKFPELIIVIQGYGFTIDLHGETFINKEGVTSSTFRSVPDQPVTSFELTLPQGPGSALAANGNLCSVTRTVLVKRRVKVRSKGHTRTVTRKVRKRVTGSLVMPTAFTGQNGAVIHQNTPIAVTGCARHKAKKTKAGRRGRHRSGKTGKGK